MRAIVTHGHLVRETRPRSQLREVLDHFDLWSSLRPFARCSVCNGLVERVAKAEIMTMLPERTATHYEDFWRCLGCGRLYWQGAHYRSLRELFSQGKGVAEGG